MSVYAGICWCMLVYVGVCRCLPMYVGICRCMSVSVGVCLCMLVISRCMLVYPGVCRCLSVAVGGCRVCRRLLVSEIQIRGPGIENCWALLSRTSGVGNVATYMCAVSGKGCFALTWYCGAVGMTLRYAFLLASCSTGAALGIARIASPVSCQNMWFGRCHGLIG